AYETDAKGHAAESPVHVPLTYRLCRYRAPSARANWNVRIVAPCRIAVVPVLSRGWRGRRHRCRAHCRRRDDHRRLVRVRIGVDGRRIDVPQSPGEPPPAVTAVVPLMFPVALAPGVEIVLMKVLDSAVPAFALVAAF